MSRIARVLAAYGVYHRDPRNRLTHYIGVPAIVYAVLIALAMGSVRVAGVAIGLDILIVAVLVLVYLVLDLRLGLTLALLFALLVWGARSTLHAGSTTALIIAAVCFVVGWGLQLYGHQLEGNRPALLDNLLQIFVAPIYLLAELMFVLGLRAPLQAAVQSAGKHDGLSAPAASVRPAH